MPGSLPSLPATPDPRSLRFRGRRPRAWLPMPASARLPCPGRFPMAASTWAALPWLLPLGCLRLADSQATSVIGAARHADLGAPQRHATSVVVRSATPTPAHSGKGQNFPRRALTFLNHRPLTCGGWSMRPWESLRRRDRRRRGVPRSHAPTKRRVDARKLSFGYRIEVRYWALAHFGRVPALMRLQRQFPGLPDQILAEAAVRLLANQPVARLLVNATRGAQ
jgi:hypothetical protein